jgi:hypothetical protein
VARSCKHCCSGQAISITYSERVSVALVIQHAMRMRHSLLSSVACPAVHYSSTLSHKRQLFKNPKILPLKSQYIFSLLLFVAKYRDSYESNSEIHNINTRFSSDLHTPTANLTTFQKGLFYFG